MSNWSNIYVMTDSEGFEEMQEIARNRASMRNLQRADVSPNDFFDYYDEQGNSVCFGFEYIFWDKEQPLVKFFMEVLEIANIEGVKWQFLRTGEHGAIERKVSDSSYNDLL